MFANYRCDVIHFVFSKEAGILLHWGSAANDSTGPLLVRRRLARDMSHAKSHHLHALEGNDRRELRGHNPACSHLPQKPETLDSVGSDLWDQLVAELVDVGLATKIDQTCLEALCDWWSQYCFYRSNPDPKHFSKRLQAWKQYAAIATAFGLTPLARNAVRMPSKPISGDDAEFFPGSKVTI